VAVFVAVEAASFLLVSVASAIFFWLRRSITALMFAVSGCRYFIVVARLSCSHDDPYEPRVSRLGHGHRAKRVSGTVNLQLIWNAKLPSDLSEPVLESAQLNMTRRRHLRGEHPATRTSLRFLLPFFVLLLLNRLSTLRTRSLSGTCRRARGVLPSGLK
jgi:hypothetical protein